jgi:CheY-like chemotaxis protein
MTSNNVSAQQPLTADGARIRALVIDDDEAFCSLLKGLLEPFGVDVKTVTNPVKALEIFTREKDNLHLVLLDYYMPHLNGTQMLEWLRKLSMNVKVILVSGMDELRVRQILAQHPVDGFIRKPFRIQVALEVIRHALNMTPARFPDASRSDEAFKPNAMTAPAGLGDQRMSTPPNMDEAQGTLPHPEVCQTKTIQSEYMMACLVKPPHPCVYVVPFGDKYFCRHPDREKFEKLPDRIGLRL